MPLPKPSRNEDESDWISRFMSDPDANREYPDHQQRLAVGFSMYRELNSSSIKAALPTPSRNEDESDWISRWMSDPDANRSYPDQQQRLAVGFDRYREVNATNIMSFVRRLKASK